MLCPLKKIMTDSFVWCFFMVLIKVLNIDVSNCSYEYFCHKICMIVLITSHNLIDILIEILTNVYLYKMSILCLLIY